VIIGVWLSGSEPTIRRSALVQRLSVRKYPRSYDHTVVGTSSQTWNPHYVTQAATVKCGEARVLTYVRTSRPLLTLAGVFVSFSLVCVVPQQRTVRPSCCLTKHATHTLIFTYSVLALHGDSVNVCQKNKASLFAYRPYLDSLE